MAQETPEEPIVLGPAALGLQRVGEEMPKPPQQQQQQQQQQPQQPPEQEQPGPVLNRRGMPARIRKKNRLFFDDDVVNLMTPRSSPKKPKTSPVKKPAVSKATPIKKKQIGHTPPSATNSNLHSKNRSSFVPRPRPRFHSQSHTPPAYPQSSPNSKHRDARRHESRERSVTPSVSSPDRRVGQQIGLRLRNLLKLPKAHKWVCYEWFYSNIDKPLFEGDNDFMSCLKESFPQLKTRNLTRVEWCKIRRLMGKPRRCSQAFFMEERQELEKKRMKIRLLQQRKMNDVANCKDLPNEIPLQLVIGTKVTARLRRPQDGLFNGSIDAVDTSNNTYRVTFERPGLGTHSVPDYEVLSNDEPETIALASFAHKFRPRGGSQFTQPSKVIDVTHRLQPEFSSASILTKPKPVPSEGCLGEYPVKLLDLVVRTSNVLNFKKTKIKSLKEMNSEAEKRKSFGSGLAFDFQRKYAVVIVELEKMNKDLQVYLTSIQNFCQEIAPEESLAAMLTPDYLRERSIEEAKDLISDFSDSNLKSYRACTLITQLTALLFQIKSLNGINKSAYEMKVLRNSLDEIYTSLDPANQQTFQNCVEVHIQHVQDRLSLRDNPFMVQSV